MYEKWYKSLRDLEKQYPDLAAVIPALVNEGGQYYAARQLNTSATVISRWLKSNGYIKKTEWVKRGELEAAS